MSGTTARNKKFATRNLNQPTPGQFTDNRTLSAFANKDYQAAMTKYKKDNPDFAIRGLENARSNYVKNTGGKLRDVKTAGAYKAMSESTQAKYRKRNPKEFPVKDVGSKLSTKSLLGS